MFWEGDQVIQPSNSKESTQHTILQTLNQLIIAIKADNSHLQTLNKLIVSSLQPTETEMSRVARQFNFKIIKGPVFLSTVLANTIDSPSSPWRYSPRGEGKRVGSVIAKTGIQ